LVAADAKMISLSEVLTCGMKRLSLCHTDPLQLMVSSNESVSREISVLPSLTVKYEFIARSSGENINKLIIVTINHICYLVNSK
jgi:hypothetical protein